jgi:hypothetical protein
MAHVNYDYNNAYYNKSSETHQQLPASQVKNTDSNNNTSALNINKLNFNGNNTALNGTHAHQHHHQNTNNNNNSNPYSYASSYNYPAYSSSANANSTGAAVASMPYTASFDQYNSAGSGNNFHPHLSNQQSQPSHHHHHHHHSSQTNHNNQTHGNHSSHSQPQQRHQQQDQQQKTTTTPSPTTPPASHLVFENKSSDPKHYFKSYYDHRYSSYEPMLDYLSNYPTNTNNQQTGPPVNGNAPQTVNGGSASSASNRETELVDKKTNGPVVTAAASNNRRPAKMKIFESDGTSNGTSKTTSSRDDADFKAFKDKFSLNNIQYAKPNVSNRHSINIDDLSSHHHNGKLNSVTVNAPPPQSMSTHSNADGGSKTSNKNTTLITNVNKPKTPLSYSAYYNVDIDQRSDNKSGSNLTTRKQNHHQQPMIINRVNDMSKVVVGPAQNGKHSPLGSNRSAESSKESPLFQKIMAKLAEVPDSILLKSYKNQPSGSNNSTSASITPNLKNISTKSIDSVLNVSMGGYGDTSLLNSSIGGLGGGSGGADFTHSRNVSLITENTNPHNSASSSKSSVVYQPSNYSSGYKPSVVSVSESNSSSKQGKFICY